MNQFLNEPRLRAWCRILAIMLAIWATLSIVREVAGTGRGGPDLAIDFTCSYAAGRLVRAGDPAAAYRTPAIYAEEHADRMLPAGTFEPVYYPPPYLFLCWPLAYLPYWPALVLFLSAGLLPLMLALRHLLPASVSLLPAFAYPGVLVNAGSGQNGFFSAACLSWFAVWLDNRPWLAGACLGLLANKPQLAIFAPLALAAAGRWRAFAGAAIAFALVCLLSLIVFGAATWAAFFAGFGHATGDLTGVVADQAKIQSVFMAVRMLGGSMTLAVAVQAAVTLGCAAVLIRFCRSCRDGRAQAAAVSAATMLGTPYFCDYDLVCLAPALAVSLARGVGQGFARYDKLLLLAAYMLPLLGRGIAASTSLQIATLAIGGLLSVIVRPRGRAAG
jgi:hypothetical protein